MGILSAVRYTFRTYMTAATGRSSSRTCRSRHRATLPILRRRCPFRSGAPGNFSNLKTGSGVPIIIYDPATVRQSPNDPTKWIRDPFPGNIISPNRIDTVAQEHGEVLSGAELHAAQRLHAAEQLPEFRSLQQRRLQQRYPVGPELDRQVAHVLPRLGVVGQQLVNQRL